MALHFFDQLPFTIIDLSIKVLILAFITWGVLQVFRVKSESWKHRVWSLMLAGTLLLPTVGLLVPSIFMPTPFLTSLPTTPVEKIDVPVIPDVSEPIVLDTFTPEDIPVDSAAPLSIPTTEIVPTEIAPKVITLPPTTLESSIADFETEPVSGDNAFSPPVVEMAPIKPIEKIEATRAEFQAWPFFLALLPWAYFSVALLLLGRLVMGLVLTQRIVQRAAIVKSSRIEGLLSVTVPVYESNEVQVPVVVGLVRPVILLPSSWQAWSQSTLQMVFTHEGEHLLRKDLWVALGANLCQAVYWFHPIIWLVRRHLSELAERACDDEVLRVTADHTSYAECLLHMASQLSTKGRTFQPLALGMARQSKVEGRINAILDSDRPLAKRIGTGIGLLLLLSVASLVALVAGINFTKQAVAEEPKVADVAVEKVTAEKADARQQISGRVVMGDSGKPVAGAEVRLSSRYETPLRLVKEIATTNKDGVFTFDQLAEGKHRLVAFYQDTASRSKRGEYLTVNLGEKNALLTLKRVPSIQVKVISRKSREILKNATIQVLRADGKDEYQTDAKGEVTLLGLTPELWDIKVKSEGYVIDRHRLLLKEGKTAVILAELDQGIELHGKVTDENGVGLSNVSIGVSGYNYPSRQSDSFQTDDSGNFRFRVLRANAISLSIYGPGYTRMRHDLPIRVGSGGKQEFNVTLKKRPVGGSVSGIVTDSKGLALPGVLVTYQDELFGSQMTQSDNEGRFLLEDIVESELTDHKLIVKAPGYVSQGLTFRLTDKSKPPKVDFALSKGHRAKGRVVDEAGKGIPEVIVYFSNGTTSFGGNLSSSTRTDKEGRFSLGDLPENASFSFHKIGLNQVPGNQVPLDSEEETIVTMKSSSSLRGRVVDAKTGKPVTSFTVQILYLPRGYLAPPYGEKFSNINGEFKVYGYSRIMPLQFIVSADGYHQGVHRSIPVTRLGRNNEIIEFRLKPIVEESLFKVSGRIVNDQSEPIPDAKVHLILNDQEPGDYDGFPFNQEPGDYDGFPFNWERTGPSYVERYYSDQNYRSTISDKNGDFEFLNVVPSGYIELNYSWGVGSYGDRITEENYGERITYLEEMTEQERTNIKLQFNPPGMIVGRVDTLGYPTAREVSIVGVGSGYRLRRTFPKDARFTPSFQMRNVPPGRYELTLYAPSEDKKGFIEGYLTKIIKSMFIEVKAGQTLYLSLGPDSTPATPKTPAPTAQKTLPTSQPIDAIAEIKKLGGTVVLNKSGEAIDVSLSRTKITDAELDHLQDLTSLNRLILQETQITDVGLERLKDLTNLTTLSLTNTQITDAGLERLKDLTNLTTLDLSNSQITDVGLEHLKDLTSLTSLGLNNTQITDAELEHLNGLTSLDYLGLGYTEVTDAGLEHLEGLTSLKSLNLAGPKITDAGLEHLKGLASLDHLNLWSTQITDTGLEHLKGLTSLRSLWLRNTQVTDAGLKHLKGLTSLTSLDLSRTQVTDTGLEHLKGLASLKMLWLRDTKITDSGVSKLKAALPKCLVK